MPQKSALIKVNELQNSDNKLHYSYFFVYALFIYISTKTRSLLKKTIENVF